MESDIVTGLTNLGYEGSIKDVDSLESRVLNVDEPNSLVELSRLVHFLAGKLHDVCEYLEESVNPITGTQEVEMFAMELSGLLRELHCPYTPLIEGPPGQRFNSREARFNLLNFLVAECEAAVMIKVDKPSIEKGESLTAQNLKSILVTLGFGKPPADVTAQQLFTKVGNKIREVLSKVNLGPPLLNVELTEKQWSKLHEIHSEFVRDYKLRRETLLKRLDVTILSFTWSNTVRTKLDEVSAAYQPIRSQMKAEPYVTISQILSARQNLACVCKTSDSAAVRKTPLHRIIIGSVPDRGGRANEQRPPPPEMPRWQKRRPDQPRGGGSQRGGRGGHRVQGGWNQGDNSSWGQDQKPHWRGGRGGRGGRR